MAPDDDAGVRLRVVVFLRPALSDSLNDADAADFVGDSVVARVLFRRTRVSVAEPASLLEVEAIGRVGDWLNVGVVLSRRLR